MRPVAWLLGLGLLASVAATAQTAPPSVEDFAADPDIREVRLSPSGATLAIVRLGPSGRYQVELRSTARLGEGGLAFDAEPAELRNVLWLSDDRLLVQARERRKQGSGGAWFDIAAVFDSKGALKFKLPGGSPALLGSPGATPGFLYLAYDGNGDGSPDVHRMNISSGRSDLVLRGSDRRGNFMTDRQGNVRVSAIYDPSKFEVNFFGRDRDGGGWSLLHTLSPRARETWRPMGFYTADPDELVVLASEGAQTAALKVFSIAQRRIVRTLYQRDDVDVDDVVVSAGGDLLGARYVTDMAQVHWLDDRQAAVAARLSNVLPNRTLYLSAPSMAGTRIGRAIGPADPTSFYLIKADGAVQPLGSASPRFDGKALAQTTFTKFRARDGLVIPLYITRPADPKRPLPLIVMPHGGPWARDYGGFDQWAQLLAAQGYLVAQPQFRGSAGLGKALWVAGDREWGGKMQDDLDDAATELQKQGLADKSRTAMFGWSYGGYAALMSTIRGHGLYRCAVAGAAVSDLDRIGALLSDNPFGRLVQKPTIAGPSPIRSAEAVAVPLLLIHGDEDQVVDVQQSRDMAARLKSLRKPYEYVELKEVGHTSDRMSAGQRLAFYRVLTKWFTSRCGF